MKFSDLKFKLHPIGDVVQAIQCFPNGYGVSVVRFTGSYGYEQDLEEVQAL